jgi:yeast amino acid transporter
MDPEEGLPETKRLVVPIFGILVAMVFAFLAFLPSQSSSAEQVGLKIL